MDTFDTASTEWLAELTELLREMQSQIDDDDRASDDDDTPAWQITIATDDECSQWVYQTGDNSFSGACYHYPHWGVATLTRDCDPAEIAAELLADLGDTWSQSQD